MDRLSRQGPGTPCVLRLGWSCSALGHRGFEARFWVYHHRRGKFLDRVRHQWHAALLGFSGILACAVVTNRFLLSDSRIDVETDSLRGSPPVAAGVVDGRFEIAASVDVSCPASVAPGTVFVCFSQ